MRERASIRSLGPVLGIALVLWACGGPTTPEPEMSLGLVGGDGQADTIGASLASPLVVGATAAGAPAAALTVAFSVTEGDLVLSDATVTTDAKGEARTEVTLGTGAGPASVTARISEAGASSAEVTFRIDVLAGAPVDVARAQDPPVRWFAGNRVLDPPSVLVTDRAGNGVPGIGGQAEWTVLEEGGSVLGFEAVERGILVGAWKLGPDPGPQRLRVSVVGDTIEFAVTAVESARIAFSSNRVSGNAQWHIFTMEPNGRDIVQVTDTDDRDKDPDWSPDRSEIVFARIPPSNVSSGLWAVDVATGELRGIAGDGGGAAWSPDGSTIVFFTKGGREGCERAVHELWLVDSEGLAQLTADPCGRGDKWPEWSPDGSRIVFDSRRESEDRTVWHVWTMNADGSDPTRITQGRGEYAHWSPDGSTIAYGDFGEGSGVAALQLVGSDGTNERIVWTPEIDDDVAYVLPGGFSPDGSFVVVEVGYVERKSDIFVVDIESGRAWNVTNRPDEFDGFPSW